MLDRFVWAGGMRPYRSKIETASIRDYMAKKAKRPINWQILATEHGFKPADMARRLGCSVRSVQRRFKRQNRKTVRRAELELRTLRIVELVRARKSGKEIIAEVGLAHVTSLSRHLKSQIKSGLCALRARL